MIASDRAGGLRDVDDRWQVQHGVHGEVAMDRQTATNASTRAGGGLQVRCSSIVLSRKISQSQTQLYNLYDVASEKSYDASLYVRADLSS